MAVYANCAHCNGTGTCKLTFCRTCGEGTVVCKVCKGTGKVKLPE